MPEFGNNQAHIVSYNVSYFLYMGKIHLWSRRHLSSKNWCLVFIWMFKIKIPTFELNKRFWQGLCRVVSGQRLTSSVTGDPSSCCSAQPSNLVSEKAKSCRPLCLWSPDFEQPGPQLSLSSLSSVVFVFHQSYTIKATRSKYPYKGIV